MYGMFPRGVGEEFTVSSRPRITLGRSFEVMHSTAGNDSTSRSLDLSRRIIKKGRERNTGIAHPNVESDQPMILFVGV